MNKVFILLFLVSSQFSFAQKGVDSATVKGVVSDYESNLKAGEVILFENKTTEDIFETTSNSNGIFELKLPCGETYLIKIQGFKDDQDYSEFELPNLKPNQSTMNVQVDIQYEESKEFTLDNVYFETGKATITKASYMELDELVGYLKARKKQIIEIGGHTDDVGEIEQNQILSQKRAQAIVDYLIKKGIATKRLKAVGYGEEKPIANNETKEGRQRNRRTEIRLLN